MKASSHQRTDKDEGFKQVSPLVPILAPPVVVPGLPSASMADSSFSFPFSVDDLENETWESLYADSAKMPHAWAILARLDADKALKKKHEALYLRCQVSVLLHREQEAFAQVRVAKRQRDLNQLKRWVGALSPAKWLGRWRAQPKLVGDGDVDADAHLAMLKSKSQDNAGCASLCPVQPPHQASSTLTQEVGRIVVPEAFRVRR